jgi:hypothetical protein
MLLTPDQVPSVSKDLSATTVFPIQVSSNGETLVIESIQEDLAPATLKGVEWQSSGLSTTLYDLEYGLKSGSCLIKYSIERNFGDPLTGEMSIPTNQILAVSFS